MRKKQKPSESLYPDVDRNRPIAMEVNDWYSVGKPIITHHLASLCDTPIHQADAPLKLKEL